MNDDHWLLRLDAAAWLRAAAAELSAGERRVDHRRTAVTHARRSAGMALNALLRAEAGATPETVDDDPALLRWGRSYVDHLRALADATDPAACAPLPARAAELARALMAIGPTPPQGLVQLGAAPNAAGRQALSLAGELVALAAAALSLAPGQAPAAPSGEPPDDPE